eukprot:Hpha_TRINITY_DN30816_c0_g1::TRINITY_DN30816_c0_g1_i1::g.155634::m.155634/K10249/ELOVL4; elongation of very long chain fatty acids protein 4
MAPWPGFVVSAHADVFRQFFSLPCAWVAVGYWGGVTFGLRHWKRRVPKVEVPPAAVALFDLGVSVYNLYVLSLLSGAAPWGLESLYDTRGTPAMAGALWWYRTGRVMELTDTLVMMLRHSFRQVSPLHVYHHASLLLLAEAAHALFPMPVLRLGLAINAGIHTIMYLYYAATAYGYTVPRGLKQTLTIIQILQFIVGCAHTGYGYLYKGMCPYAFLYAFSMLYLFARFYARTYLAPPKPKVS